jgi:hypothetical protein
VIGNSFWKDRIIDFVWIINNNGASQSRNFLFRFPLDHCSLIEAINDVDATMTNLVFLLAMSLGFPGHIKRRLRAHGRK